MREVTLITANKRTVMAGDYVEMMRFGESIPDFSYPTRIHDRNEILMTDEKINLPVVAMHKSVGDEVVSEYIALDPVMERYYQALKQSNKSLESAVSKYKQELAFANSELDRIRSSGFWPRIKWAFAALLRKN